MAIKTLFKKKMILLLLFIIGTFLRIYHLGFQSMWGDEIGLAIIAQKDILTILKTYDTNPPLSFLITHFFMKISNSDFVLRLPAAIFGISSIYVIYTLAKSFFNKNVGLLSAFLLTISVYHINYSQDIKGYAGFLFFSLVSLYFLLKLIENPSKRFLMGFILVNILNLYTHYFAIFVITIEIIIFIVFILDKRNSNNFKKLILFFFINILIIGIFFIPILQGFKGAITEVIGVKPNFNLGFFKNLICRYGAGNGINFFIYSIFFIIGLISMYLKDRKQLFIFIIWLAFPFIALSFMNLKHFFHIRYLIFTFPVFLIIIAKGISAVAEIKILRKYQILYMVIPVIFLMINLKPLKLYYGMNAKYGNWKGIAEYINKNSNENPVIVVESSENLKFVLYYLNPNFNVKLNPDKKENIMIWKNKENISYLKIDDNNLSKINLLKNGNFENYDHNGFTYWQGGLKNSLSSDRKIGNRSCFLEPTTHDQSIFQCFSNNSEFINSKITFGVWAKVAKNRTRGNIMLTIYNNGTTENLENAEKAFSDVSDEWKFYCIITKIGQNHKTLGAYIIPSDGNLNSQNNIYIDGAIIIPGELYYIIPQVYEVNSKKLTLTSVQNDKSKLQKICSMYKNIWFIADGKVFDTETTNFFNKKKNFVNPTAEELGKRELIDWEPYSVMNNSAYSPFIYYNSIDDLINRKDNKYLVLYGKNFGLVKTSNGEYWQTFYKDGEVYIYNSGNNSKADLELHLLPLNVSILRILHSENKTDIFDFNDLKLKNIVVKNVSLKKGKNKISFSLNNDNSKILFRDIKVKIKNVQ